MRPDPDRGPEPAPGRRQRRLALLLRLAPGPILIVAAVNLWGNPWLLACGLVWSGVFLIRGRNAAQPPAPAPLVSAIPQGDEP